MKINIIKCPTMSLLTIYELVKIDRNERTVYALKYKSESSNVKNKITPEALSAYVARGYNVEIREVRKDKPSRKISMRQRCLIM